MRNIERQTRFPALSIGDFRASVGIRRKDPLSWIDRYIARQYRPHQCPRNQIPEPVLGKIKPRLLLLLLGIEQGPIVRKQTFVGYFIVKGEPQMNLRRREQEGRVYSSNVL